MESAEISIDRAESEPRPGPKERGLFGTLVIPVLKALLVLVIVNVVAVFGVFFWGAICRCGQDPAAIVESLPRSSVWNLVGSLIFGGLTILYITRRGLLGDVRALIELLRLPSPASLLTGAIAGVILAMVVCWGIHPARHYAELHPRLNILSSPFSALLTLAICVPVMEEIYFRGFMLKFFLRSGGVLKAALSTSAIFAVVHSYFFWQIPTFAAGVGFAGVFTVGIFCSWLYLKYKSLWGGILLHGLYNFVLVALN